MSNAILPSLPGIGWGRKRGVQWSTTTKRAVSGREYAAANWSYPVYEYKLDYEVLRQETGTLEYEQLLGFINARKGSFDTFLYRDPWDNAATAQPFGTGDGATTQWRLVRSFGGHIEPVLGIIDTPIIFAAGVLQSSGVSVSAEGLVTFTAPPTNGAALTWTGAFYWRCRFMREGWEFNEMLYGLHELQGVGFKTVKA